MSFLKKVLASSALLATALAHPHAHDKRAEPTGTIITSCTVPGVVALTFDDGPYIYTETLLDRLAAHGFRATFFQNGANWGSIYDYSATLKRMITDRHQIASHTWDHKDLATLSDAAVQKEMTDLEVAYTSILGYYPYYMRPPFLSTSASALKVLGTLGYVVITIDIDTQDWQNLQVSQEHYSFSNYTTAYAAGGRLSLSHDPYDTTVNGYIPELLDWITGQGLTSVTVGECLGDAPENWYRTTRTNKFNPYVAAVSSSKAASSSTVASSSQAASSSSKPASASASVSASISASKISSVLSSTSASASKASSAVASPSASKASSVAASASSISQGSSAAASASLSKASSVVSASGSKASSVIAASDSASALKASSVASVAASASGSKVSSVASAAASASASKVSSAAAGSASASVVASKVSSAAAGSASASVVASKASSAAAGSASASVVASKASSAAAAASAKPSGKVSKSGACGGSKGYVCSAGECCSEYGWCGASDDYCGAGCQTDFGSCYSSGDSGSDEPSGPTTVSPDWTCGGTSGYTCPDSTCCSEYGWCGSDRDYCGSGCQSGFGSCH